MEELSAWGRAEGVEALLNQRLQIVDLHDRMLCGAHDATLGSSEPGAVDDSGEGDLPREVARHTSLSLLLGG